MGDPTTGKTKASMWPLTNNPTAYDADSIDYAGLRSSYYDLYQASKIPLNDSQVPMSRALFWPALASTLNPAQGPLETHIVATLGEHHWGFAFPSAFPMANGRGETRSRGRC